MDPGVEQWLWFADFSGFGIRDYNPVRAAAVAVNNPAIAQTESVHRYGPLLLPVSGGHVARR